MNKKKSGFKLLLDYRNLEEFIFYLNNKKAKINVKRVPWFSSGLMFKSKNPPLLFEMSKEKKIAIHSLFCKPFTAIWLDKDKKVVKVAKINKWKFMISGKGKYLLEIPEKVRK